MRAVREFLKAILVGGLLVVLPVWLTVLLLLKAVKTAIALLKPVAALLPQTVVHEDVAALLLLLVTCLVVGLLVKTPPVQKLGRAIEERVLERLPGYTLIRGVARQLAGREDASSFQPALVEIEDALVPAFIVERHPDGRITVFVSSSPTPMAGAIYILAPERVHAVDVPLRKAMVCITKWGTGSGEMLAAMINRPR